MKHDPILDAAPPQGLRMRFLNWRNRVLGSRKFQRFAARNFLLRPIARRRATALFDLLAGFTYTQTLLAMVESGLFARLSKGAAQIDELALAAGLSHEATLRLLRAAAAIEIAENAGGEWWVLGRHGASLQVNEGALAMIHHHRLLYADLADPLALLRDEDRSDTRLAQFWNYTEAGDGTEASRAMAGEYSELMAASQAAVAEEVLAAFPFTGVQSLLDVGGGNGAFLRHVAGRYPSLRLGLFDRPDVAGLAEQAFCQHELAVTPETHGGDFFTDPLPQGYDMVSLVRIMHDHDDMPAAKLLANIHRSMTPGARLLIAEPMAETRGAEGMGGAYFGWYLWAMASGRPRSAREIHSMLKQAGFRSSRSVETNQPVIASIIVATA